MNQISLTATAEEIDIKKNVVTYRTDIEAGPGLIVLSDTDGEHDMMVINQIHEGGVVSVAMKPVKVPARKYKVGDIVAKLVQF